jgi:3-oxoadipate enol-lactonase
VNGAALHYTVTGPAEAPVVLLLHGLGSSGDDWAPQVAALADRYRVLAVDLPGHHRSPRARGTASIPRMAAAVGALLDRLAIERVHVVGLSLGGCVALALALSTPERVRSLVVVNAFARVRPAGIRGALRGARRLVLAMVAPMRWVAASVAREAFPDAEHTALREAATARLAANARRSYLTCLGALLRFDVRGRLGEIRCPTLIVAGARDTTVPLAAKELLARAIPDARLQVIGDSGHVTHIDRPEAFNRLLLEHLAAVEAVRA